MRSRRDFLTFGAGLGAGFVGDEILRGQKKEGITPEAARQWLATLSREIGTYLSILEQVTQNSTPTPADILLAIEATNSIDSAFAQLHDIERAVQSFTQDSLLADTRKAIGGLENRWNAILKKRAPTEPSVIK